MSVKVTMEQKLAAAFPGAGIEIRDDSALHEGHAGARPGGESHFHLRIRGSQFAGKTRVACHRMIMDVLKEELAGPVHALAIDASD